jgi:putative molybdopterin biosynthesis protein
MNKEMLSTRDVAEYLNINEKQVYKLIKEKSIPATRVTGKWTFPKKLIDEWIIQSARHHAGSAAPQCDLHNHIIVMGSNDFSLEMLSRELTRKHPSFSLSISNIGSVNGLIALDRGIAHLASCHLLDPETGQYNEPFLKQYAPHRDIVLLNLTYRDLGLILSSENPHRITGFNDIAKSGVRFINRQKGSGTRAYSDMMLDNLGIDPAGISGYSDEVTTHTDTAIAVLSGAADVGIGILPAAKMLGLSFVHLTKERFDLAIPRELLSAQPVKDLLSIIRSKKFKAAIRSLGGYNTEETGTILRS